MCINMASSPSFRKALEQRCVSVSGGSLWGPGRGCCWADPVGSPVPREKRKEKAKW